MSTAEFGSLTLLLLVVLTFAHLLGHLFIKLRQPRVVGEILAGVVLGPSIFGHFFPHLAARIFTGNNSPGAGDHHAITGNHDCWIRHTGACGLLRDRVDDHDPALLAINLVVTVGWTLTFLSWRKDKLEEQG